MNHAEKLKEIHEELVKQMNLLDEKIQELKAEKDKVQKDIEKIHFQIDQYNLS